LIKKSNAAILGSGLLLGGVLAGFLVHTGFSLSGMLALLIAAAALAYDKWGKHHPFLGPLNMGLCRGLNVLLGMSILPAAVNGYGFIGIIPVLYIAAITMISRGEVHGGRKNILYAAGFLYAVVIASILIVSYANGTLLGTSFFLALFGLMIYGPLKKAIRDPAGPLIGKAVKAGVLALILMNAAWAAAFDEMYIAAALLLLLPLSIWLAKAFAVT
jgi:4-hydroxybenzoate polyprenyltransferase